MWDMWDLQRCQLAIGEKGERECCWYWCTAETSIESIPDIHNLYF